VGGAITSEVMVFGPDAPYRLCMPAAESRAPLAASPPLDTGVGALLRHWRTTRRLSQLDLALDADISSRHLSYVETGRSQPSREMVLRLADALEIPLRERNAMLVAAGYAPRYFETNLAAPGMVQMRSAIELILGHQEPYPAFVLDRHWEIRLSNQAAARCTRFLLGREPAESNMLRLLLPPNGLRPVLMNWEETAGDLIRHLHNQVAAAPSDERAKTLLEEVLGYPGIPARWRTREIGAPATPLLTTIFRKGDVELRFFSTITSFGTPHDVTLDELRIECSFPADEATAAACRERFGG
jgi:transcriptional regulator with XRE-family HTH domain